MSATCAMFETVVHHNMTFKYPDKNVHDYACQASSWRPHFVKKHYTHKDWTHSNHAHDVTVYTKLCCCSLHGDESSIIFKNLHFETQIQKFAFSNTPQSIVVIVNERKCIHFFCFFFVV